MYLEKCRQHRPSKTFHPTFPSKSHVPSINRDEVTLFQVRPICCDLRILALFPLVLVSCDRCFTLWGPSPPETQPANMARTTLLPVFTDNKINLLKQTLPNYSTNIINYLFMSLFLRFVGNADFRPRNTNVHSKTLPMPNQLGSPGGRCDRLANFCKVNHSIILAINTSTEVMTRRNMKGASSSYDYRIYFMGFSYNIIVRISRKPDTKQRSIMLSLNLIMYSAKG